MARAVTTERRPASNGLPPLEIRRSARRRKTASAYAKDGRIVVQIPAALPTAKAEEVITSLAKKITGKTRAEQIGGDRELERRAARLADLYLDGVRPSAVRWSNRMERQRGSCRPATGVITISNRLATYPSYVLDCVIVHELAHLLVPNHSQEFWDLVARYPESERAIGFLSGVEHAAGMVFGDHPDGDQAPESRNGDLG
jgi:predicted metal-dependent hydrolase